MKIGAVVNALLPKNSGGIRREDFGLYRVLLDKARMLSGDDDVFVLVDGPDEPELIKEHAVRVKTRNVASVLKELHGVLKDYDGFFYFSIDTPLIDVGAARDMAVLHERELAEYTYGEGYPAGFTPEIVKVAILPRLAALVKDDDGEIGRDSLFKLLSRDINSFDIETHFASRDMKLNRIELALSPMRNGMITRSIIDRAGADCSFDKFVTLVSSDPGILRTVPAYVEFEITTRMNGPCIYSGSGCLKRPAGEMAFDQYREALEKLMDFSGDLYVSLSYNGEPLLHPEVNRIIRYTAEKDGLNLILETDGVNFMPGFSDRISGLGTENIIVIFKVDAVRKETYGKIWGGDLRKVERNVRYLLSKGFPSVYLQLTRMDCNEDEMLEFFDVWEKEGANVIIQKYRTYGGLLPQRTSADLRPLERRPCWHLMRDLVVFHNGDVPRCVQDLNGGHVIGNILKDKPQDVWNGNDGVYRAHCREEYDGLCGGCDDYYTFNF